MHMHYGEKWMLRLYKISHWGKTVMIAMVGVKLDFKSRNQLPIFEVTWFSLVKSRLSQVNPQRPLCVLYVVRKKDEHCMNLTTIYLSQIVIKWWKVLSAQHANSNKTY